MENEKNNDVFLITDDKSLAAQGLVCMKEESPTLHFIDIRSNIKGKKQICLKFQDKELETNIKKMVKYIHQKNYPSSSLELLIVEPSQGQQGKLVQDEKGREQVNPDEVLGEFLRDEEIRPTFDEYQVADLSELTPRVRIQEGTVKRNGLILTTDDNQRGNYMDPHEDPIVWYVHLRSHLPGKEEIELNIIQPHMRKEIINMIKYIHAVKQNDKLLTIYINNNKVPETDEVRKQLIQEAHESSIGGHMGSQRTLEKLRTKYNWDGISKDVETYIKNCKTCQFERQKFEGIRNQPGLPDIPSSPNEKISMDTMGPLPNSRGYKYILVIQDYLTRYLVLAPMKTKNSSEVLQAFWNNYVSIFGLPKEILTDNGVEFAGEFYEKLNKKLKVNFASTSVYHLQSNGKNERSHEEILNYIRSYTDKENEWSGMLKEISLAYNSTRHEVTKISPIEFTFGYKPNIPITTIKNEIQEEEAAQDFNRNREIIKERAKMRIETFQKKTQERLKKRKTTAPDYKVGDSVLVKWKQSGTSKLRSPWDGPYK